jgi:hypothetical protein
MKTEMKKKKKKTKVHFNLTLKQLRKIRGLRQSDMKVFEQTSVSKIEGRKDLKISTLIDYLNALDMDLELRALSRPKDGLEPEIFPLIAPEPVQEMDEPTREES